MSIIVELEKMVMLYPNNMKEKEATWREEDPKLFVFELMLHYDDKFAYRGTALGRTKIWKLNCSSQS